MLKCKKNIVLIGMTGCGKTTIGLALSYRLKMPFVDMDAVIEHNENRNISEIFKTEGEPYFRALETSVAKKLSRYYGTIISTGGGVILNPENMKYLKKHAVVVYINRSVDNIIENINTEKRPLLKNGKERLYEMFEKRHPLYSKYANIEVVNSSNFEDGVENVFEALKDFI